jgi:hypothetical protein
MRATTAPSSSIRTATTSKRSAISQQKKPEPSVSSSPRFVVEVVSATQGVTARTSPYTVRTDDALKVRFIATVGEEPEV